MIGDSLRVRIASDTDEDIDRHILLIKYKSTKKSSQNALFFHKNSIYFPYVYHYDIAYKGGQNNEI
jgi:hypothetical protein